jgi:1-deoxy-D-xylulose-5-phosphate synthase
MSHNHSLLSLIDSPEDLRQIPESQLGQIASELRSYLLDTVSQCGGHFAANLGTVELTVALHYVFNTPEDKLVWDVGHQAYPHKVLTGRRDQLVTIRQTDGLHPFPNREESPFDAFGVGHSSTSISAALGMALANQRSGSARRAISIIGDGAMTAGMAFEALNHAGHVKADLLVILNDNDMSISENVGALNNYLAKILSGQTYSHLRESGKKIFSHLPGMTEIARKTEEHLKGMVTPGILFEELGFNYIGPIDGHDIDALVSTLKNMRALRGPRLLHIATTKGKGYQPAENAPIKYHAVPQFDLDKDIPKSRPSGPTYSQVFGQWLCDMAAEDERLIAITPAMREGSGMVAFSEQYPERYFDVAIAEQHAVTLAAGMACEGSKPVVAIYSSFLQRGYDQLIHDVALQNLDVLFAIDRAGIVGGDGATHQGAYDISYLRCIPNVAILTPSNENECRQALYTGYQHGGCVAVRYPRGKGPGITIESSMSLLDWGKGKIERSGSKVAILVFGPFVEEAMIAAETLDASVADMRFVKPLDHELIDKLYQEHQLLITIEENAAIGGAGTAVLEYLAQRYTEISLERLGIPDQFIEHGDPQSLKQRCCLSAEGIVEAARERLSV